MQFILEVLPEPDKRRLEDEDLMFRLCFSDRVVHAVERYKKEEERMKRQEGDIMLKVAKLQLEDLTEVGERVRLLCKSVNGPGWIT